VALCYALPMAVACPVCSRPNADSAAKCLYCSEPLDPVEPPKGGEIALSETPQKERERHLLILVPGATPTDDTVKDLSRILGMAPYDARLSLQTTRPRLIRRIDDESAARDLSQQLTRSRMPHYIVSEASVSSLAISRARRAELHGRHVRFDFETTGLPLPFEEILLFVRGEIVRERRDDKKLGTAKGVSHRLTPGLRLHVYSREAAMAIEIDPESFDWNVLEEDRTSSSLLNLERFLSRLAVSVPTAEVDRGFDFEPAMPTRAETSDVTEALAGDRGLAGVLYDNEEQFRFYSRWRYRLARHLCRG
jgi:hypothetical protein